MAYDYEKIGKQQVLKDLKKDIKGKADYLQSSGRSKVEKLKTLKDIEKMAKEAHKLLKEV